MKDEQDQQQSEVTVDFYKKLVAVGDGGCGKTSLLSSYVTGVFPENLRATVFRHRDHGGHRRQEEGSSQFVRHSRSGDVKHFSPDVPVLLVGNKKDLRNDPETIEVLRERRQSPVSYQEGLAVAKKIKAKAYMECSAKDGTGVSEVIQKACRLAIGRKKPNLFLRLFCKSCT
ncbi:hypothetical protein MTO96_032298 [Rhipicephalus appendiculatus]